MGTVARAGISQSSAGEAASGRDRLARPRCNRRGLDLRICAGRQDRAARSRAAPQHSGLVPALRAEGRPRGGRSRQYWRHGQTVSGCGRSAETRLIRGDGERRQRRAQARQSGGRWRGRRAGGGRIYRPRHWLSQNPGRLSGRADPHGRRRYPGVARRCGNGADRPGYAARDCRTQWRGRSRGRRDRHASGQECPRGDRRRPHQTVRTQGQSAARCRDRHDLRSLRADRPRCRESHRQAGRGISDRRARLRPVPVARTLSAGGDPDPAARHPDRLHRHAVSGAERQYPVTGRDRHRYRRDGRCGGGDDRERPQAPRTLVARQSRQETGRYGALARCHRCSCGSWPGAVPQPADHYLLVYSDLLAARPRGPAVRTAGFYQDLCDGRRGPAVDYIDPGPDGLADPGTHSQ